MVQGVLSGAYGNACVQRNISSRQALLITGTAHDLSSARTTSLVLTRQHLFPSALCFHKEIPMLLTHNTALTLLICDWSASPAPRSSLPAPAPLFELVRDPSIF